MARRYGGYSGDMIDIQAQALKDQRERDDRAAVASGNVDENSALYRHAKLNGWDLGGNDELHGPARADAVARNAAATRMAEAQADAMEAGIPRRRSISGFGADMDTGRATRYYNDGTQETTYNSPAEQMFAQMGQLVEQGRAARKQKRSMDDAALASALVYSSRNGGFMPREMVNAVSQQLGQQIVGGNFTSDGNYVLYGSEELTDPRTGRQVSSGRLKPIAIATPEMQYGVLSRSGLGVDVQQELYDKIQKRSGLTTDQLAAKGIVAPGARGASAAAPADGKLALDAQKTAMEQSNKNIATAQKQLEILQKRRDALAERATPDDPRLAQIDRQIATYENLVGASLTGGLDQWSAALGLGGGTGSAKAPRAARQFEGEREMKGTITRDSRFGLWGGKEVQRVQDDTRTGEKVVATKQKDANGEWVNIRLGDGDVAWDEEGYVYYREGDQVFRQSEENYPIKRKQAKNGIILSEEGGVETYIPNGRVISLGKDEAGNSINAKVVGENGHLRLVRTSEMANWTAKASADALEKMRADEVAERKAKQKADRAKEAERKRREEIANLKQLERYKGLDRANTGTPDRVERAREQAELMTRNATPKK